MGEKFLSARNGALIGASFVISLVLLGITRLSSVLFVATLRRYEAGRKHTSFAFFLVSTMRGLTGPLVGYLGRKFGSEIVTIIGCVLSVIGVGSCFLAEDLTAFTFSWGIIYGIGVGLGTSLIPEILNKYFVEHIDKANGIFLGGECFGSIMLPSITYLLLRTYGTSGTFLILSGIILHSVPAAMILMFHKSRHRSSSSKLRGDGLKAEIHHSSIMKLHNTSDKNNALYSSLPRLEPTENDYLEMKPMECETSKGIKVSDKRLKRHTGKDTESKPFRVLLDPAFILIVFTQSSDLFALTMLFMIGIDLFKDIGVLEYQEVYLLMGFAISDTIGRFFLGCLTDAGFLTKINFCILCHALMGMAVAFFALVDGFVTTMICACVSGLLAGGMIMISPGIVSLYVKKDDVMISMACRFSLYPFMSFAQPFLVEYFREHLGSYNGLLLLIAGLTVTSGLLSLFIPVAARHRENKNLNKEQQCFEKL